MAEPADKQDVQYIIQSTEDNTDRLQNDIVNSENNVLDRLFTMGRDTADLRAQVTSLYTYVKDASTIGSQATVIAVQNDGEKTRALINDLKTQDLNRMLIERNAELVESNSYKWHNNQAQWASLQSQIQAFGSQLGQAQASMVNFGTQLGVGQRATSNNVG